MARSVRIIHPQLAIDDIHVIDPSAGIALVAFFTFFALDISQGLYIVVAQGDYQNAIGGHSNIADANAVGSILAVDSLCAVLAHDHAQIGCVAIRIGQHQMPLCIDFGLCDADAVSALDIAQINACVVG